MSSFTKELIVKKKDNLWELHSEFEYHVGDEGSHDVIHVPAGFCTDFASVPRAFWMIIPPDGKYTAAAIIHDFLYSIRGKKTEGANREDRTRRDCDKIFLEAMGVLKVPWWKRRVMYRAVRSFGWIPWRKKR